MTATTSLVDAARRELSDLSESIVGPGDPGYDEARAVHNGMIDKHPALIVRCASAGRGGPLHRVRRAHSIPVAVRGGGHNGGGLGVVDDGLVIDLGEMARSRSTLVRTRSASGAARRGARSTGRRPNTVAPRRRGSSRPRGSVG